MAGRALLLVVVVAALWFPVAAAGAPPEGSLRLTLRSSGEGQLGPRSFFFSDSVYRHGRVVGSERAVCRFTGTFENPRCRVTVSLPGGKLYVFLRLTPDQRGNFTVTGGRGRYAGRTGVGIYKSVSESTTKLTIWLTPRRAR